MADRWCETVGEHRGTRLRFDTFNLYHANYWIIKPATEGYEEKGCSLVEIMAIQVQRPNWFVSHAWIEPWLMCGGRLCYCVYFKRNDFVWGWAQILVNGVGSRRGSYRNQTNPCPESWQETGACAAELVTFLMWMEDDGRQLFCCQCVYANGGCPLSTWFYHVLSPKEMVLKCIKYVVRNGTDTFYIFCLPNQRWCGTSVPIGFGPWGSFRMAWGHPVCHWDGVTSGCLG